MPEYIEEQDEPTDEDQEQDLQPTQRHNQHPSQPLEIQPDGTWILGKGANRWMPSKNQIGDLRWIVERDLCNELGVPLRDAEDEEKIEFHKRQLALLDLARQAPRCEHVFSDGRCCKAPRVKKGKLCYAHTLMEEKRPQEWDLPPLEDANAVMLWLMDALRGLLEGRITEKTAGLMFYGLQLAMVNARFTTFRDVDFEEMVRTVKKPQRTPVRLPLVAQGRLRNTKKGGFTAEGAKAAKSEEKALPQRTQRNTEEELAKDFTARAEEVAEEGSAKKGSMSRTCHGVEPQDAEVNPGVELAKSIFSGVEGGEGWGDNRPVSPPAEPPRKSSQSEVLVIPKEVEHHARR